MKPTQQAVRNLSLSPDLPAWVQQNNTRTAYTLDVANHRLVSTTGPNGGTPITTTTRHYTDGSDNPTWVDVDPDATGPAPAATTRFAESLGGDLGAQVGEDGTVDLTLATLHGDAATTVTLPAAQDENTACTGIDAWSDYTEYGRSRNTASTDAVDGPVGYGWLGARQRSTTPESAGLTLMGDRYYNPTTGRFTATDPVAGGNVNTYTYPNDPINAYDLTGRYRDDTGGDCNTSCRARSRAEMHRVWAAAKAAREAAKALRRSRNAKRWRLVAKTLSRLSTALGFAYMCAWCAVVGNVLAALSALIYWKKLGDMKSAKDQIAGIFGGFAVGKFAKMMGKTTKFFTRNKSRLGKLRRSRYLRHMEGLSSAIYGLAGEF